MEKNKEKMTEALMWIKEIENGLKKTYNNDGTIYINGYALDKLREIGEE